MNSDSIFISKSLSIILILGGVLLSALSLDYNSPITAIVGLSFILWGGILQFASPNDLVRVEILKSIYSDYQENFEKTLKVISPSNIPVYVPTREIENLGSINLYLDSDLLNRKKVHLCPTGHKLLKYIEKESEVNFSSLTIDHSFVKFKEIVVNELSFANKMDMRIDENIIEVTMINHIFYSKEKGNNKEYLKLGDPLISAIACLISKNLGDPLLIEEISYEKEKGNNKV